MKKAIKMLAVLLAVCFCTSALALAADRTASEAAAAGETFSFGMYPQTHIDKRENKELVKKLNAIYEKTGEKMIRLDGEAYAPVRVDKSGFKPGGSPFGYYYGYYPYDSEHGLETYWFRYEPIVWRVLDDDADGGVLLMAEQVLNARTFNDAVREDNTWQNSDVRTWLNDTFLKTAFTQSEQSYLLTTTLENETNPVTKVSSGDSQTDDKVFLPSFNEITEKAYGFNVDCTTYDDFGLFVGYYEVGEKSGRQATATDYAKCNSVWTHLDADMEPLDTCYYWLRTAGLNPTYAACVLPDGRVSTGWDVDYTFLGIRPMIRVAADAVAEGVAAEPAEPADPTDPTDPTNPTDPTDPTNPTDPDKAPFSVTVSATQIRYLQKDVQFEADVPVTWTSSDPTVATIDENTGEVTVTGVGPVTITATSTETGEKVAFPMEIRYTWWQQLIRIFLFGWLWY